MNINGTCSGFIVPVRLSKIKEISSFKYCVVALLMMPIITYAAENRLGTALTVQYDQDDNYLMSSTNQQTLSGLYLKPSINYNHDNGFEKFSANLHGSIERYNRSEYNASNPAYSIKYQRIMERATVNFAYDASRQSTKISDGNRGNGFSNQQTNTATAAWQYQLTERNLISLNGSMQTIKYASSDYADLKNNGLQAIWQSELSDRWSFYTVLSGSQYESTITAEFYTAPQLVQGYLLCPPNSQLEFKSVCFSDPVPSGNAINKTTSAGLQTGVKWSIQERLKFSLDVGVTALDSVQTINTPQVLIEYGPPIDQEIIFGGERSSSSDSRLVTTNLNLLYQLEASTIGLTFARKVQPNSAGALLRIQSVDFSVRKLLSEISWIEANLLIQDLLTIDEQTTNSSSVDRDIFQGTIKYGYHFNPRLMASAAIGYRRYETYESQTIKTNALLGVLAISYTPREWAW